MKLLLTCSGCSRGVLGWPARPGPVRIGGRGGGARGAGLSLDVSTMPLILRASAVCRKLWSLCWGTETVPWYMYVTSASSTLERGVRVVIYRGKPYLEFHVIEDEDRVAAGVVPEDLLEVGTAG